MKQYSATEEELHSDFEYADFEYADFEYADRGHCGEVYPPEDSFLLLDRLNEAVNNGLAGVEVFHCVR